MTQRDYHGISVTTSRHMSILLDLLTYTYFMGAAGQLKPTVINKEIVCWHPPRIKVKPLKYGRTIKGIKFEVKYAFDKRFDFLLTPPGLPLSSVRCKSSLVDKFERGENILPQLLAIQKASKTRDETEKLIGEILESSLYKALQKLPEGKYGRFEKTGAFYACNSISVPSRLAYNNKAAKRYVMFLESIPEEERAFIALLN